MGRYADLEQFLRTTPIVAWLDDEQPEQVVLRASDGREARAVVIRRRPAGRELAAYRLDRHLGLGIVPVTVARELDGHKAALQFIRDT